MFSSEVPQNVRTLFISDLHLGFRLANSIGCLKALKYFDAETTFLVGDTIDITRMGRVWCWDANHQAVVDQIERMHDQGKRVIILPGNHDPIFFRDEAFLAKFNPRSASRIERLVEPLLRLPSHESFVHETQGGKKLLVIHGDQVDKLNVRLFGIPKLGSKIFDYVSVVLPNRLTLEMRNFFKLVLTRPKKIEDRAIENARERDMDGLVMGHLHEPQLKQTADGLLVANTGDWVENSSVVVETFDGEFLLVNEGRVVSSKTI